MPAPGDVRRRVGSARIGLCDGDAGDGREQVADEQRVAHQQHVELRPTAGNGDRVVVGGQQVAPVEERLDAIAGGHIGLDVDRHAGLHLDAYGRGGDTVDVEAQIGGGGGTARVLHGRPHVQTAPPLLDGEQRDRTIGVACTDAPVRGARRLQLLLLLGQAAVAQQHEPDVGSRRLEALGERERIAEIGTAGFGGDRGEGIAERLTIAAGRQHDPGLPSGNDDAGDASRGQLVAKSLCLDLRSRNSIGVSVDGRHRSARVDDEHGVLGERRRREPHGLRDGHGRQQHGEQLSQEQCAPPQPLPRRGRADRPLDPVPQERRADRHRLAARSQDVQRHHRDRQRQQRERPGAGERHRSNPSRCQPRKSTSAMSSSASTRLYATPRRRQRAATPSSQAAVAST